MRYIKEFDSVRAFAVLLVIVEHWAPRDVDLIFPLGSIGVDIFFVLSGFLISGILINTHNQRNPQISGRWKDVGNFMARRALRIFPLYYAVLFLLLLGARFLPNPLPQDWPYYVSYLQNYLFHFRQQWPGGKLSPFWSLAVEEQFYLIWPFLLLFLPFRYLKYIFIGGIIVGAISTVSFPFILEKNELTPILTPTCIHAFCIGGLLAYLNSERHDLLRKYYPIIMIVGFMALVSFISAVLLHLPYFVAGRLLVSLFTAWLFSAILLKKANFIGPLLNNKSAIALGQVSYGVYVSHNFIPVSVAAILFKLGIKEPGNIFSSLPYSVNYLLFIAVCYIFLLIITRVSFTYYEKPFLKLKKYFAA